jgi:ribosome-binding protein aMBF1 (putative translation factor)
MANKFSELRARMPKESQERAVARAAEMTAAMPLQELRQARKLSQEMLATTLGQRQSGISKIEQRTDMYVSTLRSYIEAMGGRLDIVAHFPDGDVRINQFEEIEAA